MKSILVNHYINSKLSQNVQEHGTYVVLFLTSYDEEPDWFENGTLLKLVHFTPVLVSSFFYFIFNSLHHS